MSAKQVERRRTDAQRDRGTKKTTGEATRSGSGEATRSGSAVVFNTDKFLDHMLKISAGYMRQMNPYMRALMITRDVLSVSKEKAAEILSEYKKRK